ncbi:bromodomain-containing protein DDB_G0270170-like [Papaver somniferum]|uniref:bromodomain-containing protein DDB_G0270170-like n=1 Tax=Papaver somniferum TaxID=3469 RepID=UPI000E6F5A29|nr:bromodomain-containing protein DDB_G0270170-like [Papaver somniferum]
MEYERINKVQTGIISPSKLRLKLIGSPNKRKDGSKSNTNSARTSPAKLHDAEFVKNSLLADDYGVDSVDEGGSNTKDSEGASSLQITAPSLETSTPSSSSSVKLSAESRGKSNQFSRVSGGNNLSTVHPVRTPEEDNLDYDSNASSSSFEFHNGQRSHQNHVSRTFSRPVPCKWNDAEKWIMNRQNGQLKQSKKNNLQSQENRQYRTAGPESANSTTKMILGLDKFSFPHPGIAPSSKANGSLDLHLHPQSKDLKEVEPNVSSSTEKHAVNPPFATIRSVSMRDMGTEMTPVPSQEPSRTGTPVGATTPLRSPTSSMPSTPRRGEPTSTPVEATSDDESNPRKQSTHKNLSERELHLKTRKEIVALGVQLGKMNIAAWASKEEKEKSASTKEQIEREELERIEFENRAAAWEEAEKSKHAARYRREDIKIQAWESHCKAKLEEELRRTEAQAEKIRANAEEKMKKKIATTKQRSEEKLAAAEALRNRQAAKASAQAEYIRQTGRIPPSRFRCCSWLS